MAWRNAHAFYLEEAEAFSSKAVWVRVLSPADQARVPRVLGEVHLA